MIGTSWMRVWWIAYNKQLFDGALPRPLFRTADISHCGEYDYSAIVLSNGITTLDLAKATLLHEMVHQYQHVNGLPVDHGHLFKEQRERILAATGLEI